MSCNCRARIEEKLLERFKEKYPEAIGHQVSLTGYAFFIGDRLGMKGVMPFEMEAEHPLKKGGFKRKKMKQSMAFAYCPFCGASYGRDEDDNASTEETLA